MGSAEEKSALNEAVSGIPYFTPRHTNSPGSAIGLKDSTPTLFSPLKIRDAVLRNRIVVAPMCQYSTAHEGPDIGALTDYHVATLGHYALKGASVVFIEATGVQPNGRISPNCPGIWSDAQIPSVQRVADFIKSQGGLCAIQLAHAGRKSSTTAPWISKKLGNLSTRADTDVGGWPDNVIGPMGGEEEAWDYVPGKGAKGYWPPRAASTEDVKEMIKAFADAAKRSVKAGVDIIEIHGAHGYLVHQFLSPITNRRTDEYGGSFEGRTKFLRDIVVAIREVIPKGMPLWVRLSSTEWLEETDIGKELGTWDLESTIKLAKILPGLGVDLLDCSSGGNHPKQRLNPFETKNYQTDMAGRIRQETKAEGLNLFVGAVGLITEAEQAKDIVEASRTIGEEAAIAAKITDAKDGKEPMADVVLVARQFMREPEWVLRVAHKLDVDVAWPNQFLRVRF
ncbi:NADH oxidase [Microthyrium microscopicum]|uniref:NADH oxidase n=1 Tax=Microthyrium microscopicum TaxID=703497 RepID=A0A6A6TYE5_9PEZI|nr:NADH oxidase [Microthyrium microscopicum]